MDKIHIPEHQFLRVIWVWLTFVLSTFPICLMWWHLKLNSQQRLNLNLRPSWKKRSLCQRHWFNYWPISPQVIDKCILTQFLRNRRNVLSSKPDSFIQFLRSCMNYIFLILSLYSIFFNFFFGRVQIYNSILSFTLKFQNRKIYNLFSAVFNLYFWKN